MKIMGILNVTPDSFSDGGRWSDPDHAIAHGHELIAQGASIIDIGGESSRPGADPLSDDDEWARIDDVVTELSRHVTVSVDTYHAATAARAVEAGAHIVNDVTGGSGDPLMFETVAGLDCDYVLQHGRGNAQSMNDLAVYTGDFIDTVEHEMLTARDRAVNTGIAPDRIILDPGLGFAKVGDHDWQILANLDRFLGLGHRVLVGHSRKRFLAGTVAEDRPYEDRDVATAVVSAFLSGTTTWAVRVHNVAATASAIAVAAKLRDVKGQ